MDLEKSEPKYWSQLHTRIINKDPDAYLELYDFLCSKMKRVLFTRPNIDYQRIEDYIQDTFLAVIESANTVRFSQKFGAFIYQIAIRQQGSKYGRRLTEFDLKTIFNFDFDKSASKEETPEAILLQLELIESLAKAIQKLRPKEQEMIIRFYFFENSYINKLKNYLINH